MNKVELYPWSVSGGVAKKLDKVWWNTECYCCGPFNWSKKLCKNTLSAEHGFVILCTRCAKELGLEW